MSKIEMRYSASPNAIEAKRDDYLAAVAARREREAGFPNNDSMLSFLSREAKAWEKCDAFTLGYAAACGIDPLASYMHTRHAGEMRNIYSMPKERVAMRVLNGARFPDMGDSDAATLIGTLLALAGGVTGGKMIANALNDYMNTHAGRVGYQSGATQSGSSLRALEALGIVAKDGARAWGIADADAFSVLHAAAVAARDGTPLPPIKRKGK